MWTCPYCGYDKGMFFEDKNVQGMLCQHPNCGRFHSMTYEDDDSGNNTLYHSDF